MSSPNVIVICGPTASGKTGLAAALAKAIGGEVVSADSMQVYRRMDIGTAKPTPEETLGVPHHMIDVAEPTENYSVARYVEDAIPIVDDILSRGKVPVIAGGTGLYIDNLIAGRQFAPFEASGELRQQLEAEVREKGLPALRERLQAADPEAAVRIHPNDEKRTIRAMEVYLSTGSTISAHNAESRRQPNRYTPLTIGLNFKDRAHLRARIQKRVDVMMDRGLEREVQQLLADGLSPACTAMQAIGYKEMAAALLEGRPAAEAAEEIKLRSCQYAKRQLSWFRRNPDTHWYLWDEIPNFSDALVFSTDLCTSIGIQ